MNNEYEQKSYFYASRNALLDSYIEYAAEKYESNYAPVCQLNGYIETGNLNLITRDNNYRNLFQGYLPAKEVANITGPNTQEYVNSVLGIQTKTK